MAVPARAAVFAIWDCAMDPNLIHVDWERTFEGLVLVIVLAFLIERALSVIFETELFIKYLDKPGLKAVIASAISIFVCFQWQVDVVSMIILTEKTRPIGYVITGFVIAGGSKASLKLFRDVMDIKSTAYERKDEIQAERKVERIEALAEKNTPSSRRKAVALRRELEVQAATSKPTRAVAEMAKRADDLLSEPPTQPSASPREVG